MSPFTSLDSTRPLALVAEDDPAVRFTLCEILKSAGFRTEAVCDGTAALERCGREEDRPAVVFLDLQMPGCGGLTFLRRRKESAWVALPVVVVTGVQDPHIRREVRQLGAVALLSKPFEPAAIVEGAQAALRSRG